MPHRAPIWLSLALVPSLALAQPAPAPENPPAPLPEIPPPPPPATPNPPPTAATPPAAAPAHKVAVELTSLEMMRAKGVISQAEYDSAVADLANSAGTQAGDAPTLMLGKWSTTLYGFVEADQIFDSTQSFNDLAGNTLVARPGTYAGDHGRLIFGVRNSRIGFKLRAPEYHGVRASAQLEMDFLGNQPPNASEAAFVSNPTFRIRHFNLKLETPYVDILIGQYWDLFGWQSVYHPNTVEIQGVVGQIYSRTAQIRLSHAFKSEWAVLEVAVAAMRPPQRDSMVPEGQGGVRLSFPKWTGMTTAGSTGTSIQPLSVAVTGDIRHFEVAEFSATPKNSVGATGWGVAADAFIPVLRATKEKRGNALSLNGEFAYGYGIADLYTSMNGGVANAALPNPMMTMPPPVYAPTTGTIDGGLAVFDAMGNLNTVQWTSALAGAQYYLPGLDGRLWVSANFMRMWSNNSASIGAAAAAKTRSSENLVNANIFADVTPAIRLGLGYSWYQDNYADGTASINHRVQLSAFYLF
jgi:hypothetical protein